MVALDVDFDVYKTLTNLRATEEVTYNDVLRRLLDIKGTPSKSVQPATKGWSWKGVTLPNGTELRATHKGKVRTAKIEGDKWEQEGETYNSPTAAAFAITNYGINGWAFWSVKRPSDPSWIQIGSIRPK